MFQIMLALHLLFAIFVIGPLAHAVTTASRGLRTGDSAAIAASARMTRIYAYASVLVVIFGFGLMSSTDPDTHVAVAKFSQPWIWVSVVLWLVAVVLALAVVTPTLERAGREVTAGKPVGSLAARVAAPGGVIGVLFAVIVFLMVYQPGS